MEPVQESISGRTQLDYMKMEQELEHLPARALVVENLLLLLCMGSDYYCESGLNCSPWHPVLYSNDTLWDGQDCNRLKGTCCNPQNLLWFCKELPQPTTDNIEFCICGNNIVSDEDTPIDLVQLYIQ